MYFSCNSKSSKVIGFKLLVYLVEVDKHFRLQN